MFGFVQPIEILENLFFIERGWLNANHFVHVSKKPILIDTAYKADADATIEQIIKLGVQPSRNVNRKMTPCDNPILTPYDLNINLPIAIKAVLSFGMGVAGGSVATAGHSYSGYQFVLV